MFKYPPEVIEIFNEKIAEGEAVRDRIMKRVREFLEKVALVEDEDKRNFWKEAVKAQVWYNLQPALDQIEHFKRLKDRYKPAVLKESMDFHESKNIAKSISILNLYPFAKLRRVGGRTTALCPFHPDKNPSFTIFKDNHFKCWACGVAGDAIDFIKLLKRVNFKEAVSELAGVR